MAKCFKAGFYDDGQPGGKPQGEKPEEKKGEENSDEASEFIDSVLQNGEPDPDDTERRLKFLDTGMKAKAVLDAPSFYRVIGVPPFNAKGLNDIPPELEKDCLEALRIAIEEQQEAA